MFEAEEIRREVINALVNGLGVQLGSAHTTPVRPTVHTNRTLLKPDEVENASFVISCGRKTF